VVISVPLFAHRSMATLTRKAAILLFIGLSSATVVIRPRVPDVNSCPGYKATYVKETGSGLTAELQLAGTACNIYGRDLETLKLQVTYDSSMNLSLYIRHAFD